MILTTIAVTGDRFRSFGPYVASVSDEGRVAFQAERMDRTHTVCLSDGEGLTEIAMVGIAKVTSHPDLNRRGDVSFYGADDRGRAWVFATRGGGMRASAAGFHTIGPAGPTMNEDGVVAFRGELTEAVPGVHVVRAGGIRTVAQRDEAFTEFFGLPLVEESGTVVFRADRLGAQGIYREGDAPGQVEPIVETGAGLASIAAFPCLTPEGAVAFAGTSADGTDGAFLVRNGEVSPIAVDGSFESHRGCLVSGEAVIRIATPRGGELGFFAGPDPVADRILGIGDPLEGSTVGELAANPVSVNGRGDLAILVGLADGRGAVLRADVG